jgi:hypothetical protein
VQIGRGRPNKLLEVGGTRPRSVRFPMQASRVGSQPSGCDGRAGSCGPCATASPNRASASPTATTRRSAGAISTASSAWPLGCRRRPPRPPSSLPSPPTAQRGAGARAHPSRPSARRVPSRAHQDTLDHLHILLNDEWDPPRPALARARGLARAPRSPDPAPQPLALRAPPFGELSGRDRFVALLFVALLFVALLPCSTSRYDEGGTPPRREAPRRLPDGPRRPRRVASGRRGTGCDPCPGPPLH